MKGELYAKVFNTESALVRSQITCGTHAISTALAAILRPGDELLSPVGKPYDTLIDVIFKEGIGSLKDFKINYADVEIKDNDFDYQLIEQYILENHPKMVYVQRSRGYTSRESLSVEKIEKSKYISNLEIIPKVYEKL